MPSEPVAGTRKTRPSWWGRLWSLFYLRRAPWDIGGPRPELVRLVETGRLRPCRAIDLGCGIGENVIYLAHQGFEVVGVDISPRAVMKAQRKAEKAHVWPTFIVGDVTNLTGVEGPFDLALDNGCLHSIVGNKAREAYVQTLLHITQPGSRYFLRCFVRKPNSRLGLPWPIKDGEVERRFAGDFHIEKLEPMPPGLGPADAVYLMTRRSM